MNAEVACCNARHFRLASPTLPKIRCLPVVAMAIAAFAALGVRAQIAPAVPAPAASAASAPAAEGKALPRVVISSSPESDDSLRRRESIAMSVYGREELDRQGDIDITEVLKRLPGVSVDGGAPRLRGLGGGYTQILINGEPAPPGFAMDSLAPGDVERIEVVKGATAEYPGVAGTINVVLREPPRTQQLEWRAHANYRALQPGGGNGFQWGDRSGALSFVVPLNIARSAQASDYRSERSARTPQGELQAQAIAGRDEGRSGSAQIAPRLQWKLDEFQTFNLGAFVQRVESVARTERRIDSLLGTPWLTAADSARTDSDSEITRLNLQWQRRLEEGGKLELKSSWQDTQRGSSGHYQARRDDGSIRLLRDSRSEFDDERSALGGRWSQPIGLAHTLALGWDVEQREREELRRVWDDGIERLDSATGQPFEARIERAAVFVQDQWAIDERWALQPGLRMEQVRTRSQDEGGAIDNRVRVAAPVLHLNYRFDPKGRDQLRASLSRSFKMPDLALLMSRYQLNGNYERDVTNTPIAADRAGNPRLRPELSSGLDLAFEHYPAGGGVLSIGVFFRRIDALIRQRIGLEADPAPGVVDAPRWVSRPVNAGRASSHGLELELKGRAEDWLPAWFGPDSGVQLRSAWNFYRSKVEQVEGPDNRLEAQPPWSANMGFDARVPNSGWTLGASLVLQPGYTTRQTDRQLSRRSGLRTLDAFAAWRIDRGTQLRLAAANLLAPDNVSSNWVEDIDGFTAGGGTRRDTLRALTASLVMRF